MSAAQAITPADDAMLQRLAARTRPMLFLRGVKAGRMALVATLALPAAATRPVLRTAETEVEPALLMERYGVAILAYRFSLPAERPAWYELGGERHPVFSDLSGDIRLAFVSCNGQEEGDRERPQAERNVLWARLGALNEAAPIGLLLHGGDQIYADEILLAHPMTREWARQGGDPGAGASEETIADITEALNRVLLERYLELYGQEEISRVLARIPSLAIWDDHDICDGWGSLPAEKLDSPVGKALFAVAREHFLLFQVGAAPQALPETLLDATGASLSFAVKLPGLTVVAPDLRSERRRERVMGSAGWAALEKALGEVKEGRVLLLSSVPALGPRLSLIEAVMRITPVAEKYEDDLRDQWQSRTHRGEWRRFLKLLLQTHARPGVAVTVVSGEIHLATRGTLAAEKGPLHQLVASGITHPPPPKAYALALSALARLGEAPLKEHPIRLHPLPGKASVYTAERNFLMLERRGDDWETWWELESGATGRMGV
ncbi:alkaline phosphatase D family protein [Afifella pfennigii]|uniref:alkaline phosphatase D family protein n=1 Tax=Afifella pfennigii TaxID=209897 RepID=UPI000A026BBA|nr:alkaline phosphatase D family protein [Afifella pfennigii]